MLSAHNKKDLYRTFHFKCFTFPWPVWQIGTVFSILLDQIPVIHWNFFSFDKYLKLLTNALCSKYQQKFVKTNSWFYRIYATWCHSKFFLIAFFLHSQRDVKQFYVIFLFSRCRVIVIIVTFYLVGRCSSFSAITKRK